MCTLSGRVPDSTATVPINSPVTVTVTTEGVVRNRIMQDLAMCHQGTYDVTLWV